MTLGSAGALNGTPNAAGNFTFLVRASNGVNSGARQITIVVTPLAPQAPPPASAMSELPITRL